ncbi:MAG: DUF4956 domain-containing protein [Eubacteriales bacterium]|nr:DUF4956 domain-containing protein [Eubacteriales bacterium]
MLKTIITSPMTLSCFLICVLSAFVLGILSALVFSSGNRYTSSWKISIALLPAVVTVVIIMVNGNLGAGVAVAGTFALTRFRSQPGSAKELTGLFFAVALGLICGMGYIGLALLFFVLMSSVVLLLTHLHFGEADSSIRMLKITIPENLDYDEIFNDLFGAYTKMHQLIRVKTTNMGTMYELTYEVILKNPDSSKKFIDELRCRNGNLTIIFGREKDTGSM